MDSDFSLALLISAMKHRSSLKLILMVDEFFLTYKHFANNEYFF